MTKKVFLQYFDMMAGPPLLWLLKFLPSARETAPVPAAENIRCLFIRPGGIGDAVALLPAIRFVKANNCNWRIDVLSEKRNADIFRTCESITSTYTYDSPHGILKCLSNGYDIAIDTEQWYILSAITALMSAPYRVGFGTNKRKSIFSHISPYYADENETECFMRLVEIFSGTGRHGKTRFLTPPFLRLNDFAYKTVTERVNRIRTGKKVSISVGGSIPEKVWEKDSFRSLIKNLLGQGIGVVLVGGKDDRDRAKKIMNGLILPENPDTVFLDLTGTTTLLQTAAAVGKTSLLLSGDTGVLHIGAAMGISTVSLFGPGNSDKWAPSQKNHILINADVQCSPCSRFGFTPECIKNRACMKSISSGEVEKAVLRLLNTGSDTPA